MTTCIGGCYQIVHRNETLIDIVLITKFRASLVPAAAVIPAELEMDNFVAVKTYVVTVVSILIPFGIHHVNRLPY